MTADRLLDIWEFLPRERVRGSVLAGMRLARKQPSWVDAEQLVFVELPLAILESIPEARSDYGIEVRTVRRLTDYLRDTYGRYYLRELVRDTVSLEPYEEILSDPEDPEATVIARLTQAETRAAVERLPRRERELVETLMHGEPGDGEGRRKGGRMGALGELTLEDLARREGVTKWALIPVLKSAKAKLREELG